MQTLTSVHGRTGQYFSGGGESAICLTVPKLARLLAIIIEAYVKPHELGLKMNNVDC